jgi:hypothetical protein
VRCRSARAIRYRAKNVQALGALHSDGDASAYGEFDDAVQFGLEPHLLISLDALAREDCLPLKQVLVVGVFGRQLCRRGKLWTPTS